MSEENKNSNPNPHSKGYDKTLYGTEFGFIKLPIYVNKGQDITVTASGKIKFIKWVGNGYPRDPDGRDEHGNIENAPETHPAPNLVRNSLVMRIGLGGAPFQAGTNTKIFAKEEGDIYVCNNDDKVDDNDGWWSVSVYVTNHQFNPPPYTARIDIHCHLFNVYFTLMEVTIGLWNEYLKQFSNENSSDAEYLEMIDISGTVKYIADLAYVGTSNCNQNFQFERTEFRKSKMGKLGPLIITPLMMDIVYLFESNDPKQKTSEKGIVPPHLKNEFIKMTEKLKNDILSQIHSRQEDPDINKIVAEYIKDSFSKIINKVTQTEINKEHSLTIIGHNNKETYMTFGYQMHLNELENLFYNNIEAVYPFLAVDPRRPGIMNLVREKVRKGIGPFWGIKLYPPLGYSPAHPELYPLYEYCIENKIPITVHTAPGGLKKPIPRMWLKRSIDGVITDEPYDLTPDNTSGYFAADPLEWNPILKKFPKLIVNFAHFGGEKHIKDFSNNPSIKGNWSRTIIDLMTKYENVYCDISYVAEKNAELSISKLLSRYPILDKRLMFGTDYILILLEKELGGLKNYFDKYSFLSDRHLLFNAYKFLFGKTFNSPTNHNEIKTDNYNEK